MATEATIGGNGDLFVGEDKTLVLGPVLDDDGVPVDISGWSIRFTVAKTDKSTALLLDKSASITGAYNANVALNTQRASVNITSAEMDALKGQTYRHSWKRTTAPETILSYGDFTVQKATTP